MQGVNEVILRLPIGVWVAAVPTGTAVYTNEAFREILGRDPNGSIGDAADRYGILDRFGRPYPAERLPFSRVVQTQAPAVVDDLVISRPDGGRVNVRAFAHPLFDGAGTLSHVSVAFIDITREVQAEAERDRAAAQLALAVDHAPIVIWSADAAGVITLSRGAALASLGVRSGDLVGHNVFELYRDHPTISGYIRQALAGESLQYIVEVGTAVFDTWLTPIRNPEGGVIGVTGLSHDIRELRRLQAAGIQSDRTAALGRLAASVAHEINNPLTYILAHGEQIESAIERLQGLGSSLSGAVGSEVQGALATLRQDVQTLRLGTERIATITRELRTFNHPDDMSRGPVDARAAVRSVLQLVGKELEARARLSLDLRETAPILGHPSRLVQVILNLVMNAMQSLPASAASLGEVHISTETRDGRVLIDVSDSGPGVSPAERERIFDPFVTTKPIGEGTGLGLFVCRNIVQGYAGEISVHDRPGGGASFRVSLPVAPEARAADAPALERPAAATVTRAHVLLIDDDTRVLAALSGRLRRAGYQTSVCSTGAEGLSQLLEHEGIDIAFCDLMMKGMTGMDLHAELSKRASGLLAKVVFMTGGACSPQSRKFVLEHSESVVEKPFDPLAEVRKRLGQRA